LTILKEFEQKVSVDLTLKGFPEISKVYTKKIND